MPADGSAALTLRLQTYLADIAQAREDEYASRDPDDIAGARHRAQEAERWLGRLVYENAQELGL